MCLTFWPQNVISVKSQKWPKSPLSLTSTVDKYSHNGLFLVVSIANCVSWYGSLPFVGVNGNEKREVTVIIPFGCWWLLLIYEGQMQCMYFPFIYYFISPHDLKIHFLKLSMQNSSSKVVCYYILHYSPKEWKNIIKYNLRF